MNAIKRHFLVGFLAVSFLWPLWKDNETAFVTISLHSVHAPQYTTYYDTLDAPSSAQNRFDSHQIHEHWATWKKALFLADYCFASIGFELMNGQTDSLFAFDPSFRLGQHDSIAYQCLERSTLFLQLCRDLLHLPGRIIHIPGIHSFPLICIDQKEYIIDPYDPFLTLNTEQNQWLSWQELKSGTPCIVVRSSRLFGPSRELIDRKWYSHISQLGPGSFESNWQQWIQTKIKTLDSSSIPKHYPRKGRFTTSVLFPFAIDLWDRQDGELELKKQYGLPQRQMETLQMKPNY